MTTNPKTVAARKAVRSGAQAEALGEPTEILYDGATYVIAPSNEWDLDVLDNIEGGKLVAAMRSLLGDAQWARFRQKPRTAADLNHLYEAVQEALGLGN